ncbi:Aspartyl-tRNA synthetase [uncultured virus]|nr:Aspartyl-tRNA synthetase [uncultured virus]
MLESTLKGKVEVKARIATFRKGRKISFVLIKGYNNKTMQAVVNSEHKSLLDSPPESILLIRGELKQTSTEVKMADYKNIELMVEGFEVVSEAEKFPFLVKDVDNVGNQLLLEHPWLAHRSSGKQLIMKTKALFLKYARQYLDANNFIETQTPKIIAGASESGSEVFKLEYFGRNACLAQSPQLYKQMLINSDYGRVYEVGPIFRAENSQTNRHLCEFTGFDIEMAIDHGFMEVIKMAWNMIYIIFNQLNENLPTGSPRLIMPSDPLVITFEAGAKLLQEHVIESGLDITKVCNPAWLDSNRNFQFQDPLQDISTTNEKLLGQIVKEKYNSDLFVLTNYPRAVRPFYTKVSENDSNYTDSFDIILRGIEISSGAQRVDNVDELISNMKAKGIDIDNMKYYVESFRYGSWPHGGCGFGVERIISCYLGLNDVPGCSYCPRTPVRCEP